MQYHHKPQKIADKLNLKVAPWLGWWCVGLDACVIQGSLENILSTHDCKNKKSQKGKAQCGMVMIELMVATCTD